MREQDFWRLIRRARRATPRRRRRLADSRETLTHLSLLLEELPLSQIVNFHRHLDRVHRRAHRWDLWTTVAPTEAHRSICRLILRGHRAFRRAPRHPDTLSGLPPDPGDAAEICLLARELLDPLTEEEDEHTRRLLDRTLADLLPPIGYPAGADSRLS